MSSFDHSRASTQPESPKSEIRLKKGLVVRFVITPDTPDTNRMPSGTSWLPTNPAEDHESHLSHPRLDLAVRSLHRQSSGREPMVASAELANLPSTPLRRVVPAWKVVPGQQVEYRDVANGIASGLRSAPLIGPADGSVHLEVALCQLEPGGRVDAHVHPFEESFYVLEGEGVFAVADQAYRVGPDSFGFAPIRTAHQWMNRSDNPLVWLRTRSPQSRAIGDASGTYPVADGLEFVAVKSTDVDDRTRRHVGRFEDDMMPTPGPLQMKGLRAPAARNVAVWMLVDELIGAVHHTKFQVRFDPTGPSMTLGGQHFHPFEETYYITSGSAVAHLEDESIEVAPGDLVFAGVNALHGFSNLGTEPVRWIEMQAPNPPTSNAFFFKGDWQLP
jgi:mannose-6-phosphate isomerase-like protein (cupin superfamily)